MVPKRPGSRRELGVGGPGDRPQGEGQAGRPALGQRHQAGDRSRGQDNAGSGQEVGCLGRAEGQVVRAKLADGIVEAQRGDGDRCRSTRCEEHRGSNRHGPANCGERPPGSTGPDPMGIVDHQCERGAAGCQRVRQAVQDLTGRVLSGRRVERDVRVDGRDPPECRRQVADQHIDPVEVRIDGQPGNRLGAPSRDLAQQRGLAVARRRRDQADPGRGGIAKPINELRSLEMARPDLRSSQARLREDLLRVARQAPARRAHARPGAGRVLRRPRPSSERCRIGQRPARLEIGSLHGRTR